MNPNNPLLKVQDLSIGIKISDSETLRIVENLSFHIKKGEIYSLVGESGCGKSITAMSLLGLLPESGEYTSGTVTFKNTSIEKASEPELMALRGKKIAMIFQEPASALDPLMTIGSQMLEVFKCHHEKPDLDICEKMLISTGIADPKRVLKNYPHECSGGMQQRIMIAMALTLKPDLIIADEPTTALDVTIQAQIMELLMDLQKKSNVAILLITHNLNLVAQYSDRVGVMYAGRMVEEADTQHFFDNPTHPYSKALLNALPQPNSTLSDLKPIKGTVPSPADYPSGCRFKQRCSKATDACFVLPEFININNHHKVACFNKEEGS